MATTVATGCHAFRTPVEPGSRWFTWVFPARSEAVPQISQTFRGSSLPAETRPPGNVTH